MHLLATLQYFDLGGRTIRQVWLSCTLLSGLGKSLLYESMTSSYCRLSSLVTASISAPILSRAGPSLVSSTPGFVV